MLWHVSPETSWCVLCAFDGIPHQKTNWPNGARHPLHLLDCPSERGCAGNSPVSERDQGLIRRLRGIHLAKNLADVLDLCERIQIVTGLFSLVASEKKPSPEDVLKGTVKDLVSQSYLVTADRGSVIAIDMDTEIAERYTFEADGSVSATEVKITKTEEDEEDQEWE